MLDRREAGGADGTISMCVCECEWPSLSAMALAIASSLDVLSLALAAPNEPFLIPHPAYESFGFTDQTKHKLEPNENFSW